MNQQLWKRPIVSEEVLTRLIGSPSELVIRKQLPQLDQHMRSFIAQSPFVSLGTVDRAGRCDVSPRGDGPPVANVLDEHTLVIAERPGNRRADSLHNILETGRIGLLFMIPGLGETLRVNGAACLFQDEELLATMAVQGKPPLLGIGVEVEECYLQCAKAVIRSQLWTPPASRPAPSLPCFAEMLIDQTRIPVDSVESLQRQIDEAYAQKLY